EEDDAEEAVRRVAPLPLPEPLPVAHDYVETDRHLEILRRLPEQREDRVVEVPPAARGEVRGKVDSNAAVAARADRFLHRTFGVEQRDVGHRVEPRGLGAAELGQPSVGGARARGGGAGAGGGALA